MIVAVTGHRPKRLGKYEPQRLVDLAIAALKHYQSDLVYTGMALGFDQAIAEAAFTLGVPYQAVLPFNEQPAKWGKADYQRWDWLLANSVQPVQVIGRVDKWREAFKARNRWMVSQLDPKHDMVLSLWDGRTYGGTYHCVWYARGRDIRVRNLWGSWQKGRQNSGKDQE